MAANLETTRKVYELFGKGEIPTLMNDHLDAACVWISPGPGDRLPWAGEFKGKPAILDFFTRVAQNLEFTEVVIREMIEQGDTVVIFGASAVRIKKTQKMMNEEWVHIVKYNQGMIVSFREYNDSAMFLVAMS